MLGQSGDLRALQALAAIAMATGKFLTVPPTPKPSLVLGGAKIRARGARVRLTARAGEEISQ